MCTIHKRHVHDSSQVYPVSKVKTKSPSYDYFSYCLYNMHSRSRECSSQASRKTTTSPRKESREYSNESRAQTCNHQAVPSQTNAHLTETYTPQSASTQGVQAYRAQQDTAEANFHSSLARTTPLTCPGSMSSKTQRQDSWRSELELLVAVGGEHDVARPAGGCRAVTQAV